MASTTVFPTPVTNKKVELLRLLWENQNVAIAARLYGSDGRPSDEEALAAVGRNIDYFGGRAIKIDLRGATYDLRWYLRDCPSGTLDAIESQLLELGSP